MKPITPMLVALALWGCGAQVDFKQGVPTQEMVSVNTIPQKGTGQMGAGQGQQALLGDPSDSVALTRGATAAVNGATLWILGSLKAVTDHPATSVQGEKAVWGPFTPELSPTTWKLTVARSGGRSFNYMLEGKQKSQPDTAYQTVLSGTHEATGVVGYGSGNFRIDWQSAAAVGGQTGQTASDAEVKYSHTSASAPTTVDVEFQAIQSGSSTPTTYATYHYKSTPNVGGEFSFGTDIVAWWDPSSPTDHWSIKSRWQTNGAGRADATLTGPNLSTPATQNECWDQNFASQYMYNSADSSKRWGSASSCVYANAEYAQP